VSKIKWTQTARNDLRAIYEFIGRDSRQYAQRTIDRIRAAAERLDANPYSGGKVLEWDRQDVRGPDT
jgi:plasmid stabilization system protein ParE